MSIEIDRASMARHRTATSIRRLRFTILFLAMMLFANLFAGSLAFTLPRQMLADWGIGHDSLLLGEVFRLITGIFLSHDPDMFIRQTVFAAAVIGYTERRRGPVRAALLFFSLDITGTVILLACVGCAVGVVDLRSTNDVGMSIGGFGLIGVAIAEWRGKWLLPAALLLTIAVKFATSPDLLADGGHVLALFSGFVLGGLLPCPQPSVSVEGGNAL